MARRRVIITATLSVVAGASLLIAPAVSTAQIDTSIETGASTDTPPADDLEKTTAQPPTDPAERENPTGPGIGAEDETGKETDTPPVDDPSNVGGEPRDPADGG